MKTNRPATCECTDPGCSAHQGHHTCNHKATEHLYRCDMEDRTGEWFCPECADDALASGVFR